MSRGSRERFRPAWQGSVNGSRETKYAPVWKGQREFKDWYGDLDDAGDEAYEWLKRQCNEEHTSEELPPFGDTEAYARWLEFGAEAQKCKACNPKRAWNGEVR